MMHATDTFTNLARRYFWLFMGALLFIFGLVILSLSVNDLLLERREVFGSLRVVDPWSR